MGDEIDDEVLQDLYTWVDEIPLSRPKRNITRDFSDGVMIAELVKHFFPLYVEMHNYAPASSSKQKATNWDLLNRKVFKKLRFEVADDVIRQISINKSFVVERVLLMLRTKIDRALWEQKNGGRFSDASEQPEADQQQLPAKKSHPSKKQPHVTQSETNHRTKPAASKPALKSNPSVDRKQNSVPGGGMTARSEIKVKPTLVHDEDTVPRIQYEEKEQECLAKEETLQILQAKVRRLEHLLHLKDIRIDDLQTRLDQTRPTAKTQTQGRAVKAGR